MICRSNEIREKEKKFHNCDYLGWQSFEKKSKIFPIWQICKEVATSMVDKNGLNSRSVNSHQ